MAPFNIETVFWSNPREVNTRDGKRRARTWVIPKNSPFWDLWHSNRAVLKEQGYTVSLWQGQWTLTQWLGSNGEAKRPKKKSAARLPAGFNKRWQEVVRIYKEIKRKTGEDYSWQHPSIQRLCVALATHDGALDASDTGTGKTAVACAVAYLLQRDLFVMCPKNVIVPWKRMAKLFKVKITAINYEMLRTGRTPYGSWAVDTGTRKRKNPLRKFVYATRLRQDEVLFVFDECHRLKDYRTQTCAMGISALDANYHTLALSATAVDNPMHMKFVGLLTKLFDHPNHFYGWMLHHGVSKGKWGLTFNVRGSGEVMRGLHQRIFPEHGSRIRVSELGDRFPETRVISEPYEMENENAIKRVYEIMKKEIDALRKKKQGDWHTNVLTTRLRARQEVELLKVPTLVQMADDALAEGMNVVVILNFSDSITALSREWGTTNLSVGDTPHKYRQPLIDRFNADREHKLVMNIKCGGLGIGVQGKRGGRPRRVLISPTDSGPDMRQALGRAPRAGGAYSLQTVVWAAGTIEENVCDNSREKLMRLDLFNDGELNQCLTLY